MNQPAIDTPLDPAPADPPAPEPSSADGTTPAPSPSPPPGQEPSAEPTEPPKGYFETLPDDWRKQLAGDDEKRLKLLERVPDVPTLVENYLNAQDKIRRGEISNGLPENPTDEQIADWREAQGIPPEPGKYELSLEDGLVLDETDSRIMEGIYEVAHKNNIPAAAMSELTNAMLQGRQKEQEAIEFKDSQDKAQVDKMLKDAWGGDYQMNINLAKAYLSAQLPQESMEKFVNARMPDGTAVFNDPHIMMMIANTQRELDPAATVVPDAINQVQSINEEIKQIESGKHPTIPEIASPEWYKDAEGQARYRALLDARDKLEKRNG
jgi:hypothetical protein